METSNLPPAPHIPEQNLLRVGRRPSYRGTFGARIDGDGFDDGEQLLAGSDG